MIRLERLTRQQVLIAGLVAIVVIGGAMFFFLIRPTKRVISALEQRRDNASTIVAQRPQAEEELKKAKEELAKEKSKLETYIATKMIPIDLRDPMKAMFTLWVEHHRTLGRKIEEFFSKSGVTLLTPVQVPPPPTDPSAIPSDLYTISLGSYQVRGSFSSLLNFLRKMSRFPRVALLTGININGPSPVTAGFDLTVYYFPKGAPTPLGAPGAPSAGMPGMGMPGPMGGMPGMGAGMGMPGKAPTAGAGMGSGMAGKAPMPMMPMMGPGMGSGMGMPGKAPMAGGMSSPGAGR